MYKIRNECKAYIFGGKLGNPEDFVLIVYSAFLIFILLLLVVVVAAVVLHVQQYVITKPKTVKKQFHFEPPLQILFIKLSSSL